MKVIEIGAKVGAERCKDGKPHTGKRKVNLPESDEDITSGKFTAAATAECKKVGVEFSLVACTEAGYRLLHQRDMGNKIRAKYGKTEDKAAGRNRDLTDAEMV